MGYGWTIVGDQFAAPPICYSHGTKILCEDGYIAIQDLKPGITVTTYLHGNLPIEEIKSSKMVNNPNDWTKCMYRLPSKNPEFDDLVVTGGHGILKNVLTPDEIKMDTIWFNLNKKYSKIDGLFLQRAAFCNEFVKDHSNKEYTYYHLSLKGKNGRRYGIWANGVLSESTFNKLI